MSRTAIKNFEARLVRAPMKIPFVTALGARTETINAALTLRLRGGAAGYGEASTSLAQKHLSPSRLLSAVTRIARDARGIDASDWRPACARAKKIAGDATPALAAFESALLSALTAEHEMTLSQFFGGAKLRAESDFTISATRDVQAAAAAAGEAAADGFKVLKVKVGTGFADDMARVQAVCARAPRAKLIIDGNQGMTPTGALRFLDAARRAGSKIILLEQPVPKYDLKGMAFVCRRAGIPVAADESVSDAASALRVLDKQAATAINIKLAKSGILGALDIIAIARAANIPLMIGCMAETARGLFASVSLALGAGCFDVVDLDSDLLLREDAQSRSLAGWRRSGPVISLSRF